MKRHMLAATVLVAWLFVLTLGASRASADTVTYNFTSCHVTGGCGPGPYGSVKLTQNGANVDVVVTLEAGAYFVKTGSGDNEAFKLVGLPSTTTLTNGQFTITAPLSPALVVDGPGSYDGDGTGNFAFGIRCPSCGGGEAGKFAGPIDFTVTNATIAQLTVANSLGYVFVADVLLPNGNTGPIDASIPSVPDGGMTLMLLGGGLVGLATLRRKFGV